MTAYRVLGVAEDASDETVRHAYKRLAREHHPDFNPEDPEAIRRFQDIEFAYDRLNSAEKRREYDARILEQRTREQTIRAREQEARRAERERQGEPARADAEQRREGQAAEARRREQKRQRAREAQARQEAEERRLQELWDRLFPVASVRGEDEHVEVTLDSDKARAGVSWSVTLRNADICPGCHGVGRVRPSGMGEFVCRSCDGAGVTERTRAVPVLLPPGLSDGAVLRAKGLGRRPQGFGPPGDLLITVRVKPVPPPARPTHVIVAADYATDRYWSTAARVGLSLGVLLVVGVVAYLAWPAVERLLADGPRDLPDSYQVLDWEEREASDLLAEVAAADRLGFDEIDGWAARLSPLCTAMTQADLVDAEGRTGPDGVLEDYPQGLAPTEIASLHLYYRERFAGSLLTTLAALGATPEPTCSGQVSWVTLVAGDAVQETGSAVDDWCSAAGIPAGACGASAILR